MGWFWFIWRIPSYGCGVFGRVLVSFFWVCCTLIGGTDFSPQIRDRLCYYGTLFSICMLNYSMAPIVANYDDSLLKYLVIITIHCNILHGNNYMFFRLMLSEFICTTGATKSCSKAHACATGSGSLSCLAFKGYWPSVWWLERKSSDRRDNDRWTDKTKRFTFKWMCV